MVFRRIPDPYTREADLASDEVSVGDPNKGDSEYVALRATLVVDEKEVACDSLYGIPEAEAGACAYANVRATRSLCARVFEQTPSVQAATL